MADPVTRLRRMAALVTVVVLAVASAPTVAADATPPATATVAADTTEAGPFPDVPEGHRFAEAIGWMADNDLAGGYPDGGYHPTAPVSRQAAAAFLARYAGHDEPPPACTTAPFPDVPTAHRFCAEIAWLAAEGIAGGYPDGRFHPTAPVSRQAIAAFLYRLRHATPTPTATCPDAPPFPDVLLTHRFCGEIDWLAERSIAGGYPDGGFHPTAPISRQAAAAFLHHLDPGCEPATESCPRPAVDGDLDGDRIADPVVWSEHDWVEFTWWDLARDDGPLAVIGGDMFPVTGDFDGDGRNEPAVVRGPHTVRLADGRDISFAIDPDLWMVCGPPTAHVVVGDWDGSGVDQLGWYCQETSTWYLPGRDPVVFGKPADDHHRWDVAVPADYDGDGTTDLAVYRFSTGTWWVEGVDGSFAAGFPVGLPVPADYDGDGADEPAVFDLVTGEWQFADGSRHALPGGVDPAQAFPAPADYDGDGRADLAVADHAQGLFTTSTGVQVALPDDVVPAVLSDAGLRPLQHLRWLAPGCTIPELHCPRYSVDGDVDRDGLSDPLWYRLLPGAPGRWFLGEDPDHIAEMPAGVVGAPGDYDGDGRWEPAWVDVATGTWTTTGAAGTLELPPPPCGDPGDDLLSPMVGDFDRDLRDEPAWYCAADATWYFHDGSTLVFGQPHPVVPDWAVVDGAAAPPSYHDIPVVLLDEAWDWDVPGVYRPTDGSFHSPEAVGAPQPWRALGLPSLQGWVWHPLHAAFSYSDLPSFRIMGDPDDASTRLLPGPLDLDGDAGFELGALSSNADSGTDTWDLQPWGLFELPFAPGARNVPSTLPASSLLALPRVEAMAERCVQFSACPPGHVFPDPSP